MWWTRAKFKHSPWQFLNSHIILCVLRHRRKNHHMLWTFFPSFFQSHLFKPAPAYILLFTLTPTDSLTSTLKIKKPKLLVASPLNLLLFTFSFISLSHAHITGFLPAGCLGKIKMFPCLELWLCRMSEGGISMIRGRTVSLWRLWGAKAALTFTGNGTFRSPWRYFAWRMWLYCIWNIHNQRQVNSKTSDRNTLQPNKLNHRCYGSQSHNMYFPC